eukprot:CAMPEP_0195529652 /NCGR_PEP_ID=MMETSP0794_2-20130614/32273_1 /TAXON_ID=515487 /ORGANISM="Stephanopyxis turris, Strain CCMP 815" /LENGTH=66 /DNA_ID=CAMNT_0040660999 /DNA_START=78 /DNA_END=274 /DNA_ORIENTATION=-
MAAISLRVPSADLFFFCPMAFSAALTYPIYVALDVTVGAPPSCLGEVEAADIAVAAATRAAMRALS